MKITKIIIVIMSFSSLLYAMEDAEYASGCKHILGDVLSVVRAYSDPTKDITSFSHSRSYLPKLKLTDLCVFNNLTKLVLEDCFIEQLQIDAGKTLPKLSALSLARNYLKKVEFEKILIMAPQLKQLNLSWNPIEEIILENEYLHEHLNFINLSKTDYLEQAKKNEFDDKIKNSKKQGKKPLIEW